LGFRYKRGPLIKKLNAYIIKQVNQLLNASTPKIQTINPKPYKLIWIDKAIFITPRTTRYLKSLTSKLVHFTPDPAFTFHKSKLFRQSLGYYDFAITTKQYELDYFRRFLPIDRLIYATQGFDKKLHLPSIKFEDKNKGVLFIGHYEKERELVVEMLLNNNIDVSIAGIKWEKFAKQHAQNKYFTYFGKGIYGQDYVKALSNYYFSWGSVSKWIPELHTTRTFEIPACGTALITERNSEITAFFNDDEAIFYDSLDELIEKINYYQNHPQELEQLTQKGTERVHRDGRDYESILRKVLYEIGMLPILE